MHYILMKFNLLLAINRLGPSISYNPPPPFALQILFFFFESIFLYIHCNIEKGCELLLFNKGLG